MFVTVEIVVYTYLRNLNSSNAQSKNIVAVVARNQRPVKVSPWNHFLRSDVEKY